MIRRTADGGVKSDVSGTSSSAAMPPIAARRPTVSTSNGIPRTDDYAWLRADNWQQVMRDPSVLAPEIREYLEAENAYTEAAMADAEALRLDLFAEMRGRIKEDDSSVPAPDGRYAYAIRYSEGDEHPTIMRSSRDGNSERAILDANLLASGKAYFRLGGSMHSPDHRLFAYAFDDKGSEYFTLQIRDVESGKDLADMIPATAGGGCHCWSKLWGDARQWEALPRCCLSRRRPI